MTHLRRLLFLGLSLVGSQLSTGCYLGYTNRPVLFPNIAITPARPVLGTGGGVCGPSCYREFGGGAGCGGSLFPGPLAGGVSGPVYDAPGVVYDGPAYGGAYGGGVPGCTNCGGGIPIASGYGGPPIAGTPGVPVVPSGGVPMQMPGGANSGIPFDSGAVPTVTPPGGSVPLQMPNEVKKLAVK
jgi:hypothetical protein